MRRLSEEKFKKRAAELANAKKIFGPLTERNITTAFQIYQEILAEEDFMVLLDSAIEGTRGRRFFDTFERPICPNCGEDLFLTQITEPEGPKNKLGWKTLWFCEEDNCIFENYSRKTVRDWAQILPKKEEKP